MDFAKGAVRPNPRDATQGATGLDALLLSAKLRVQGSRGRSQHKMESIVRSSHVKSITIVLLLWFISATPSTKRTPEQRWWLCPSAWMWHRSLKGKRTLLRPVDGAFRWNFGEDLMEHGDPMTCAQQTPKILVTSAFMIGLQGKTQTWWDLYGSIAMGPEEKQ